jgi:hypothetical protein
MLSRLKVAGKTGFVFLVTLALLSCSYPQSAFAAGEDAGLNSGNATVDRASVPGMTILKYQTTGASTFTAPTGATSVRVLVVAGGGSGGNNHGGGGGGGELYHNTSFAVTSGTPMTVAVGGGGAAQTTSGHPGNDGGDSTFGSVTVNGGGGGGSRDGGAATGPGKPGGSGGGGGGNTFNVDSRPGGASVKTGGGLGNAGGNGDASITQQAGNGGGGGGAASAGANGTPSAGGNGGSGITNDNTGVAVGYAGGGGGNGWASQGRAAGTATHGGGAGATGNNQVGVAATTNTGGGGGGGGPAFGDGGAGGSGTVIVQFATQEAVMITVVDNLTSEDGDTATFKVRLSSQPSAAVTIPLSSSNTTEATVPASITIQPANWNNPDANVVTVTGVDDVVADGAVAVTIITGDVTSADSFFDAVTASDVDDVTIYNQNNDPPGVAVTIADNTSGEDGSTAKVRFALLSAPSGNVVIPISLSDTGEATLNGVTSITITPANWNQPQNNEVTITGVDDDFADGDILYSLVTGNPTSSDGTYDALTASDIADPSLTNIDDDSIPDGDNDGVLNSIEDAAPNGGDANNDGTFDSAQAYVASFVNSVTNEYAVLEVDQACQINAVSITNESSNTTADAGFSYPAGLMNFTINCGTPSFIATVNQYYYNATDSSFVLRKYNPNSHAYSTISSASLSQVTIGGQTLTKATFQITDGSALDMDGTANGVIVDPAGLALAAGTSTSSGDLADTGENAGLYTLLAVLLLSASLGAMFRHKLVSFARRVKTH